MAFRVRLPILFFGAAYKKVFRWYSEDAEGVRTPVSLSGMEGRIQLRTGPGETPVLADWSTANGRLIFEDTNKITIQVPLSETFQYFFDRADWDLIIWPSGTVEEGELIMYGEVSGQRAITEVS